MIRVLTSLIRNAPGPFKGPRALTADFLEGLIDVVSPPVDAEPAPPPKPVAVEKRPEPARVSASDAAPQKPAALQKPAAPQPVAGSAPARKGGDGVHRAGDRAAKLREALTRADWLRSQDFKVLAIFFEAHHREMGAITAKGAAKLGAEIGLTIRHENIRKVVRTRLTEWVDTTMVVDSQPPTFQYEINETGVEHFESEYLSKL
jgi:hypothetical protein